MGFFSSKKKVYVSSVVYNLLGNQQPTQYLPTVVFGGVLKQTDSLGTTIKDGLLNGPGMRLRKFFKWVRNSGYADEVGLATSTFYPDVPINKEDLADIIKQQNPDYISVEVTSASINYYDYTYIADQYVYNNRPDKLNDDYIVEEFAVLIGYHYVTVREKDDEGHWVTKRKRIDDYRYDIRITFTDGTKAEINSSSYNKDGQYLYAVYIYTYEEENWLGRPEIKQRTQYIVYCKNTGNAQYDAFFKEVVPLQKTYAPYIPLRTWNTFLGEGYMPTTYEFAKKAFKRAVGSNNYVSLISDLKKNKSIGDIDFAYVVFGVALNTPYKEGKQYIFTYLYNLWLNKRISDAISGKPEDVYGSSFFNRVNNPRQVNIKSNYGSINYNIWFEWGTMTHYYGTGQAKAGLKEGDYHFYAKNQVYSQEDEDGEVTTYTVEHSYFCHQITPVRYEVIDVTNFTYANLIYKGKSVVYSGLDALNGSDGPNETGFIIPLQEQSFKESGLVYTSQLAQSTYYCVFNCYVVKKVRWYQSGIFGFVIAIVIAVVVTVVTWNPAAGGAAAGAAIGLVTSLASSIAQIHDKKNEARIEALQEQIDTLEQSYDSLGKSVEKAYSSDASKLINQQNVLLEQQKVLIQQQIQEERSKKNADDNRIAEWEQQIADINNLIDENKEKAIDAIFGEDVQSAIENFSSAVADARASNEDKAQAAKDTVKKMMQQMVTESIKSFIASSKKMEEIRAKLQEFYVDNVLSVWEQDYITDMAEKLQKEIDNKFGWADSLISDSDTSREGTKKGIATASQESVDENNARLNTIMGHTYSINQNTLETRKEATATRMTMQDIRDLGRTAVEYLGTIAKNTAELYETNKRLRKIEQSVDDINTRGVTLK